MKDYNLFLNALEKLISFKSVLDVPSDNAPFGEENKKALDYFLGLAKSFGFSTVNYDGFAGEVSFGEGDEIGIIGHLDVVPAGEGWNTDPYKLTKINDVFFARGITDDKAPTLLCLFALKELKDSGIIPNKKFRLFLGLNEESGWKDIDYLKTKTVLPNQGFSPDADFPAIYSEKGPARIEFSIPTSKKISNFFGGTVANAIPDYAFIEGEIKLSLIEKYNLKLNGNKIESFGKTAHGSKPELGINAIKPLFLYLNELENGTYSNVVNFIFNDIKKISKTVSEEGKTTFSPNLVRTKGEFITLTVDMRIPPLLDLIDFIPTLNSFNIDYKVLSYRAPHLANKNSAFVLALVSSYNEVMGENLSATACSGATFASVFNEGVAFGIEFPSKNFHIHEPNEFLPEKDLLKAYDIYKTAIFKLAK